MSKMTRTEAIRRLVCLKDIVETMLLIAKSKMSTRIEYRVAAEVCQEFLTLLDKTSDELLERSTALHHKTLEFQGFLKQKQKVSEENE